MAGLIVFGAVGFMRMGISQLPEVDFPVVSVQITLEGAAPSVMEASVADPLEDQLMSIEGLRTLTTVSTVGSITSTLEFELSRSIDGAMQETQNKVTAAQKFLPRTIDPPTITKTNPDDQPIIWLALTGKGKQQRELMTFARDTIKDRFTTLSGVGSVVLGGFVEPAMRVWLDPYKMRSNNIAATDIIKAINQENLETPGGDFDSEKKNLNLRTMGEAVTPKDFGEIVINNRAGRFNQETTQLVRLRDVAKIEPGLQNITRISRFNGEPAVGIGVVKQKGSNAVAVAELVRERVEEVKKTLPPDWELHVNFDTSEFIEEAIHHLNMTLIYSALLTAVACWIFLGSWSATFNVLMSIPTSIMGAFIVLYFMGFTLNTFTLLGLSLAIGIVVDDAIMVLENIFRHNEEGRNRMESAIIGAREITFAALVATVAIVAIFLPVAFMSGIIGRFFFQFGVTISVTVLLSLVEALTITPMRCSRFVTIHKRTDFIGRNFEAGMEKLKAWYTKTLSLCLDHPWEVVAAACIFMVCSFSLVMLLKKEFSPPQDQSVFLVRVKTPIDSSIWHTDDLLKKAEVYLKTRPEIRQFYVAVGGLQIAGSLNQAIVFVTMHKMGDRPKDKEKGRPLTQQEFMRVVRQDLLKIDPEFEVFLQDLSQRGFTASRGFPIEFSIRGTDWDELWKISKDLMDKMKQSGLAADVDTDFLLGKPELQVEPDREFAAVRGVTVEDIGTTLQAMIGGVRVNQYTENGHRYYVMVQVEPKYRNPDTIKNLLIANSANNMTPLSQTVKAEVKPAMQQTTRIGRQRAITIFANPAPGHSQSEALDFVAKETEKLPPGYRMVLSGSAQTFKESFESLMVALVLGIFVAYMVLATQFNSFVDPISVLVALPFSLSGAFLALLLTGQSLNIYSMIGLILLMGIVKKNSILLVEFANTVRDRGVSNVTDALREACPVRLRPILMTSFACVTAAIPEAIATGPGAETTIPMAVSIIGGVTVSTVLTLYVVPCVYELFSRIQKRQENHEEIKQAFKNVGDEGIEGAEIEHAAKA